MAEERTCPRCGEPRPAEGPAEHPSPIQCVRRLTMRLSETEAERDSEAAWAQEYHTDWRAAKAEVDRMTRLHEEAVAKAVELAERLERARRFALPDGTIVEGSLSEPRRWTVTRPNRRAGVAYLSRGAGWGPWDRHGCYFPSLDAAFAALDAARRETGGTEG